MRTEKICWGLPVVIDESVPEKTGFIVNPTIRPVLSESFASAIDQLKDFKFPSIELIFDKPKEKYVSQLTEKKESLKDSINKLQTKLKAFEQFPDDDFEEGTIIAFDRRFEPNGHIYHYAGVKLHHGGWCITGGKNPYSMSWDALIETITEKGELLAFVVVTEVQDII